MHSGSPAAAARASSCLDDPKRAARPQNRRGKEVVIRLTRFPLGPAERAIDATLAGPLPEIVGRALVEHRVVDRVLESMLQAAARQDGDEAVLRSPALERWLASEEAGTLAAAALDRVARTPAFRASVAQLVSSPEIRHALQESASGFGEETAAAARAKARAADDRVEARVHRLLRRPAAEPGLGGVATRGIALLVDALLAQTVFVVGAASVALVLGLAGGLAPGWLSGSLAGGGWLLVTAAYFAVSWTAAGQTPGQRLMRLSVVTGAGGRPSLLRALVRYAGLILAIAPLFAGFLPALVDRHRRALPDYLAGTVVRYDP